MAKYETNRFNTNLNKASHMPFHLIVVLVTV